MKTKRSINYVAVVVLLVGCILLGVGVHFLHAFQVKRNAHILLEQADQAEQKGENQQALVYLAQYLGMVPNDTAVLARYGLLADKQARNGKEHQRAFEVLDKVLRLDSSRADIRRHVARLAIDLRLFSDAHHHLGILQKDDPTAVELLHLQARCEAGELHFAEAVNYYQQAVTSAPTQVDLAVEYAELLRWSPLKEPDSADHVLDNLLAAAPNSKDAQLAAARYYAAVGSKDAVEKAAKAVAVAVNELKATDVDTFLLAGRLAVSQRNLKQAQEYLERGLKLHPQDAQLNQQLARLDLQSGHPEQAWEKVKSASQTLPTKVEELWDLGNLLIELDKPDNVDDVRKRLLEGRHQWAADALQAQLLMHQRKWGEARVLLETISASHLPTPAVEAQVALQLANCHEQLGNPDQQLRAASLSLERLPIPAARRSKAKALMALGKTAEALREYKALEQTPEVRALQAQLLLDATVRLPPDARAANWKELEQLLTDLPAELSTRLIEAEMLMAQGKLSAARALMDAERQRDPKHVEPWLFLIAVAERDDVKTVLPLVDDAERQTGRRVEWTLLRVRHVLRSGDDKAGDELKKLEGEVRNFEGADRNRLLASLGQAFLLVGDDASAVRLWRELAGNQPDNLRVRIRLIERAYAVGDDKELAQLVEEVRRLEGVGGVVTAYGEAARLIVRGRDGDKTALAQARRLLQEAESQRPSWPALPLLAAEAFEVEGRTDKALEKYQAALSRGEGRLRVVRRVLDILAGQGRFAEAQVLLNSLPQQARALGGLDRVGVQLALLHADQADEAEARQHTLEKARAAIPKDSKDYRDYLWLGQMQLLADRKPEAETAFREARKWAEALPDTDPKRKPALGQTWTALILLLAQTEARKVEAEAELSAAKEKLPADLRPQVLGPCYEALGRTKEAENEYLTSARSDTLVSQRNLVVFYLRAGQPDKAEPFLRKLCDARQKNAEATAAWARRKLALVLAMRGNYQRFQEAKELVKESADETLEDRKTRALVLASRPEYRRDAIHLFELLTPGQEAVAADVRFALAQLYEADGQWDLAVRQLRSLLEDDKKNLHYHVYTARALLRHKEVLEARTVVERLVKLNATPLEKLELRVRVLDAEDKKAEAIKLVLNYAKEKDARLANAAIMLEVLGAKDEAEKLLRNYVALSKEPMSLLMLASFLGRSDRLTDAFALCESVWSNDKRSLEMVARVSVQLMRNPQATREQVQTVEKHLVEARSKQPKMIVFPLLTAELFDNVARYDAAEAAYREALKQEPKNAVALNNLANLLALQESKRDEALRAIHAALAEAGPVAEMLDTRGVVYLHSDRPDAAIRDLQQAITQAATPAMYFHLAQALQLAKDAGQAKDAYSKAKDLGLKTTDLHPLDRAAWEQMKRDFE
jgi:cellulose synthase operon protein C